MTPEQLIIADLSRALRRSRERRRLSRPALAGLLGLSTNTLWRLEAGQNVSIQTYVRAAHALGLTVRVDAD